MTPVTGAGRASQGEGDSAPAIQQPWPSPSRGWITVGVFCLAALVSYTDRQILSLLVDPLRADLMISDTQVGLLQGVAFAVAYAFMGLPIGRMADISNRRRLLLAGITIWSFGTFLCGVAESFSTLFFGRMIVGLGEAALAPCALSMIGDMFPPNRRGLATGTFLTGMLAGQGLSVVVGGALPVVAAAGAFAAVPFIGGLVPWRATLVILGVSGVVLFFIVAALREPARRTAEATENPADISFLAELYLLRWRLAPAILGFGLMTIGDIAMMSWVPPLLSRTYALPSAEIGAKLGAIVLVTGIGATMIGGVLSDRARARFGIPGRSYFSVASAGLALPAAVIVMAAGPDQTLAMVAWWIFFSTMSGVGGIMAVQEAVSNQLRGLSFSLISFVSISFGVTIGAGLPGMISDSFAMSSGGLATALTICIVPAGLLAIFCYLEAARQAAKPVHTTTELA